VRAWGRSTLVVLGAAVLAACPHDFTRRGRDGARDPDTRAGERAHPHDLAREAPCLTNADCVDPHPCTEDTCTSAGCSHVPTSGQCFIGGGCFAAGDINPASSCEHCDPSVAQLSYTKFLGKGCVATVAGGIGSGYADGPAAAAQFRSPGGVRVDSSGVYVADTLNDRIRKISEGIVITAAGGQPCGMQDGQGANASFCSPWGITVSPLDGLVVADASNHAIRRVDLKTYVVSTLVGDGTEGFSDGPAATAKLKLPYAVAYGPKGIYFATNFRIRVIAGDGSRTVSTLAGSGVWGFKDGAATESQFKDVQGLAVDGDDIYVADSGNHRIRHVRGDGATTTLAGSGSNFFKDGTGAEAGFANPTGLAIASSTSSSLVLYVADTFHDRIRTLAVAGAKVTVSTLAGDGVTGLRDGAAATARFWSPMGLAVDSGGRIYVADSGNHAIRVINP